MCKKFLLITLIIAIPIAACGPNQSDQLKANKDLVQRFTTALNNADWNALDELVTEDFQRHCQATHDVQVKSRDEFKNLQKSFLVSMPDQKVTNEMILAEGDKVAAYSTYSGTHTGPMGDIPATGKSVDLKCMGIFRIEKGKIAELWVEWDNISMLTQLGLFPPPSK